MRRHPVQHCLLPPAQGLFHATAGPQRLGLAGQDIERAWNHARPRQFVVGTFFPEKHPLAGIVKNRLREGFLTRAARPGTARAPISPCFRRTPPKWRFVCLTTAARRNSNASSCPNTPIRSGTVTPRRRARPGLRLSGPRSLRAGRRAPLQPEQAAARSVRARAHRRAHWNPAVLRLHEWQTER